jgi:hypothetical protein
MKNTRARVAPKPGNGKINASRKTSPRRARSGTRRKKRPGKPIFLVAFVTFALMGVVILGSILHARVLLIRRERAVEPSLQVLQLIKAAREDQLRYARAVAASSVSRGLNPAAVAAIIVVESGGNPLTVSPTGDLGLMQVNVRVHAKAFDFQNRNLLNPEENIDVGTSILKIMLKRHGEEKAIAAYNGLLPEKRAYSGKVQAVLEKAGIPPQWRNVAISGTSLARWSDWWSAVQQFF